MNYVLSQNPIGCLNPVGRIQIDSPVFSSQNVFSLSDLAARKIVQHVEWTRVAVDLVPHTVYNSLLRAALLLNHEQSIAPVIFSYPHQTISLADLLGQSLYPNISAYLKDESMLDRLRSSQLQTASLVSSFISAIKSPNSEPLVCRELDLVGYASAEAVILYLSANLQLIENQRFQDLMLAKVSQLCEAQGYSIPSAIQARIDQTSSHKEDLSQTYVTKPYYMPKNRYKVRLDVSVPSEDVYKSLFDTLKISQREDVLLTMEVDKLDISSLHGSQVLELIKATNYDLHGLALSLCRFEDESPKEFFDSLQRFPYITSLSLSYLTWSQKHRQEVFHHLGSALSQMPHLQRLDLSATLFHGKLKEVLIGVNHLNIQYLNLSACCLRHSDYLYLSSTECHLRSSITDLILNDNMTNQAIDPIPALVHCFAAGWPNLEVLQLTDMDIRDGFLLSLVESLTNGAPQLCLLDLSNNISVGAHGLATCVERLVHLSNIRYLHLSLPRDCFRNEDMDIDDEDEEDQNLVQVMDISQRTLFIDRLNNAVDHFNPHLKIVFTDWE